MIYQNGNVQIHLQVKNEVKEQFERTYPGCRTRFLQNCLLIALTDKSFFDKVFFIDFYNQMR